MSEHHAYNYGRMDEQLRVKESEAEIENLNQEIQQLKILISEKDKALSTGLQAILGAEAAFGGRFPFTIGEVKTALALTPTTLPKLFSEVEVQPLVDALNFIKKYADAQQFRRDMLPDTLTDKVNAALVAFTKTMEDK